MPVLPSSHQVFSIAGCLALMFLAGVLPACADALESVEVRPAESGPRVAEVVSSIDIGEFSDRDVAIERIAEADFVYLGEIHDRAYDHQAQLEIIQALYDRDPTLTIAMEMFQQSFQADVDAYLAGDIEEDELVARTEYETRWGFSWELYAPILRFARDRQIPVIAANVPAELTYKVARNGIEALSGEDFRYAPPLEDIDLSDADYRNSLYEVFAQHLEIGGASREPSPEGFERFFAAQVLWDETIAASVAETYRQQPDRQIVVLLGRGHVAYDFGVPSRVRRRLDRDFTTTEISIFFSQDDNERADGTSDPEGRRQVDYFWSFEPLSP